MRGIRYFLGSTRTFRIGVDQGDSISMDLVNPADLTGASAEVILSDDDGDVRLALPCLPNTDAGVLLWTIAPGQIDLQPSTYNADLWIDWPDGQSQHVTRFAFTVSGGGR